MLEFRRRRRRGGRGCGLGGEQVDQRMPGLRAGLAHCLHREELEVAVWLACTAVVAGVEEGEEALALALALGGIRLGSGCGPRF